MKRLILIPGSLLILALNMGCSHDADKEKEEALEEASKEEVEVDRDILGDDEIELND